MRMTPSLITKNVSFFSDLWFPSGTVGSSEGEAAQGEHCPLSPSILVPGSFDEALHLPPFFGVHGNEVFKEGDGVDHDPAGLLFSSDSGEFILDPVIGKIEVSS
jgi:hypothetical protein